MSDSEEQELEEKETTRPRAYVFTKNNYKTTDLKQFKRVNYRYICYGVETGEKNGTPHLQGYVYFKDGKTQSAAEKQLVKCWCEPARGTCEQNQLYTSKQGEWVEDGIAPMTQKQKGDGEKRRHEEAFKAAEEGRWDDVPADIKIRHTGNLLKINKGCFKKKPKLEELDYYPGLWLWGVVDGGKTYDAKHKYGEYFDKHMNMYFCGYDGEDVIWIDEFTKEHAYMFYYLKKWADLGPFNGAIKTKAPVWMRPKWVIVTSNYKMEDCFPDLDEISMQALRKRFTSIHYPYPHPLAKSNNKKPSMEQLKLTGCAKLD